MSLPIIKHCLICEDIRLEQRNLASFMGVYGWTPYADISIFDFRLPVAFCAVFHGDPADGKLAITLQVRAPDGMRLQGAISPEINEQTFQPQFPSAFAFKVNIVFPKPDVYSLVVLSNGVEFFKDTFRMSDAPRQ
jgi:hypothetical protein